MIQHEKFKIKKFHLTFVFWKERKKLNLKIKFFYWSFHVPWYKYILLFSSYSETCCYFTSGNVPSQPSPPVLKQAYMNRLHLEWERRTFDDDFNLQIEDESMVRISILDLDVFYRCKVAILMELLEKAILFF